MCCFFTGRRRGRNAAFFAPSGERKTAFGSAARSGKNARQPPRAFGNLHGRRPRQERRTNEKQRFILLRRRRGRNAMTGTLRAAAAHAAAEIHASARPRAERPHSPQHGRNQKNGRTLRSGMLKKDARFSNKKAARPHEDSARTSRLTEKPFPTGHDARKKPEKHRRSFPASVPIPGIEDGRRNAVIN